MSRQISELDRKTLEAILNNLGAPKSDLLRAADVAARAGNRHLEELLRRAAKLVAHDSKHPVLAAAWRAAFMDGLID